MSCFQKDSPGKDKKGNWLPSPDGDFGLFMRPTQIMVTVCKIP
jgi:hypothetical protein